MKKNYKKSQIANRVILGLLLVGLFFTVFGLSKTITSVDEIAMSKTPEAILASAGVTEKSTISLPVAYFDQKADPCVNMFDFGARKALREKQFEWTGCDYYNREVEQGLVDYYLGEDYLPVAKGGDLASNVGLSDMTRWFKAVEGKSKGYSGTIDLTYTAIPSAEFSFEADEFYPLDEAKFSASDAVNSDGHNHLFTMNFAIPFTVTGDGEEYFEIAADDDTFVFLGDKLVIDMGGIHDTTSGKLAIYENGEVYTAMGDQELTYSGVNVKKGDGLAIRIFHADRDSAGSVFKINFAGMNLNVVQTELADAETGIQVAYDPTDPSYIGPLGQSSTVRPDGTKGYIVIATVEGFMIIVLSIFLAIIIRSMVKQRVTR